MIEELSKYKNKSSIVLLPKDDLEFYDSFNYTLKNVIKVNDEKEDKRIIDILNNSKINKIYLVGNNDIYSFILPRLRNKIEVCWVFNGCFSSLSNPGTRYMLHLIFEYYDRQLIKSVGCISKDTQMVLKNAGYKCEFIDLKIKKIKGTVKKSNSIGILSNDFDPNNNFYNQLAALTFVDYSTCKFLCVMKATKNFIKFFNLKCSIQKKIDDVMKDNFVNLYINFTNTISELIIKSFNLGIPCLVGNTDFFDKNHYLKEHLVVKSDDDINEIVSKINFVRENGKEILEEYNRL